MSKNNSTLDRYYHLIWTVKYHEGALAHEQERKECKRLLQRIAGEYAMEIDSIAVDDHVHLSIRIPSQRSVDRAVELLKRTSAEMMLQLFPYLKQMHCAGELWSDDYCVFEN